MTFSEALELLKDGIPVYRKGWNGKDMYVFLVKGSTFKVSRPPLNEFFPEGREVTYKPHLDMRYTDGTIGVWLTATPDILSDDWEIKEHLEK